MVKKYTVFAFNISVVGHFPFIVAAASQSWCLRLPATHVVIVNDSTGLCLIKGPCL